MDTVSNSRAGFWSARVPIHWQAESLQTKSLRPVSKPLDLETLAVYGEGSFT